MSVMRHVACAMLLIPLLALGGLPAAQAAPKAPARQAAAPSEQFVDGIAAIVNKQVITKSQVAEKSVQVAQQMRQQRIPVPEPAVLHRQVLQQMINEALQAQEAERVGLNVSDAQVDRAIATVAQRNRVSVERMKQEIIASGMDWNAYRNEIRTQVRDDILRQRFVEENINISDSDINAFLSSHADMPVQIPESEQPPQEEEPPPPPVHTGPELFELAQILVEVPDYASNTTVDEKRKEAEAILKKLKSGADFAGLAASSSDGPQALEGGNMGIRPLKGWPDLFAKAVKGVRAGGITGVLQSGRGFHILKVLRRGYAQPPKQAAKPAPRREPPAPRTTTGPVMVTQTHARHILIKTSKVMSDDKARQILEGLRTRIEHGESFAELAKRYSEDGSAAKGGDLGWLNPGETVPAFDNAMKALQPGQVSEPVKTPFGWHLIQVEGRRSENVTDELRRMQARRELMQRRIGPAYEDWLDQLRAQAYIDNRLEKAADRGN